MLEYGKASQDFQARLISVGHLQEAIGAVMAAVQKAIDEREVDALTRFAWWKDGVEYVGCGIKTLKQAKAEAEKRAGGEK